MKLRHFAFQVRLSSCVVAQRVLEWLSYLHELCKCSWPYRNSLAHNMMQCALRLYVLVAHYVITNSSDWSITVGYIGAEFTFLYACIQGSRRSTNFHLGQYKRSQSERRF